MAHVVQEGEEYEGTTLTECDPSIFDTDGYEIRIEPEPDMPGVAWILFVRDGVVAKRFSVGSWFSSDKVDPPKPGTVLMEPEDL